MDDLIEIWRKIIVSNQKSWVLFENGTVVLSAKPHLDLTEYAVDQLNGFGAVHLGSPSGDFSVVVLKDHPGWVVTCHHPDILNFVSKSEVDEGNNEVTIGLLGRSKRDADSRDLRIVHIEDNRS